MSVTRIADWGWSTTWWSWNDAVRSGPTWQDIACHGFNLIEAAAWFLFAALVLIRWTKYRRSTIEIAYSLTFLLFGVSDVVEAWRLTSWLLCWKLVNLVVLFRLRRIVIQRYYPDNRLY